MKYQFATEKLSINLFDSASELKNEIRRIVKKRKDTFWELCNLTSRDGDFYLCFRKTKMKLESPGDEYVKTKLTNRRVL